MKAAALTYPKASPWYFVPFLYFQQGLPVIIVQQVSVLLYKKMGIPNDQIGLWTSLIIWPWILKMFWGPLVDMNGRKRSWVLGMQILITLALIACAFAITTESFLAISLCIFLVTAFFSATHDIALDGYYMLALRQEHQAFFMGIRSTFFRLAMVFSNGVLVMIAGYYEKSGISISESWRIALLTGALVYGILMVYAFVVMPNLENDGPVSTEGGPSFIEAVRSFFKQPKIVPILLFILFYRFGESMLTKMAGPFLLDPQAAGGIGLDTLQVGMILGNVGVICLVAGGLIGGIAISRYGLRRCAWPMVLVMTIPNLFYIWVAYAQPGAGAIYVLTALEQFGYGFGMASYMVFAMYCSQGSKFATSHYAIVTGLMALGAMLAGISSGYIQKSVGYFWFFVIVCIATIPGMILLKFIPLDVGTRKEGLEV
ncbi:MAG TPA: MFS transporter [Bdellovibrionales bacterium]|nr:MAG: hypothetical protein A2Z97_05115 [Bdellovibrionales bacterium GWB1_52_6]OFZ04570.1 MAG: hypothetical protein A2X97_13190 [Bdellovibrionales bacterium GWA1_52_35]OFZ42949.1 MAG: hypothetical protein A2070_10350 [Bdellovibrionales bacterium GWC1_52_8]HAR43635.1 MFS transporter [Bdellovibrionales bacterium]HCM39981.1 MFS transporter [Bdellovibrionales bacterium]